MFTTPNNIKQRSWLYFQHIFGSGIMLKYIQGGDTHSLCRQDLSTHSGTDQNYVNLIAFRELLEKQKSLFYCSVVKIVKSAVITSTIHQQTSNVRTCKKQLEWKGMDINSCLLNVVWSNIKGTRDIKQQEKHTQNIQDEFGLNTNSYSP